MPDISYTHGACGAPLLGETIGRNLDRTTERFPDSRIPPFTLSNATDPGRHFDPTSSRSVVGF